MNIFNGGWSYTNVEMTALFQNIDLNKEYLNYNILEFGGGDSSSKILNLFQKNVKDLKYFIFESNENYLPENKENFNIIIYDETDIEKINLENFIDKDIAFDLVLIDGPNGDKRKHWYNKIKSFVKIGTIILVDDFNHYSCFSEELDNNFEYTLLSYSDIPFVPYGEHSWKIVKVKNIK
jgi:predicted O-methyltransferase YrrM